MPPMAIAIPVAKALRKVSVFFFIDKLLSWYNSFSLLTSAIPLYHSDSFLSKYVCIGKAPKISEPLYSGLIRLQVNENMSEFNQVENVLCTVSVKVAGTAYLHLSVQVEVVVYKV